MSSRASDARAARLADAFVAACRLELRALKPGNVHIFADGHGMTVGDFERSAVASAPFVAAPGATVGERVRGAVEASWDAVGCNTNLGILLLAAPLLCAAERAPPGGLRDSLDEVLRDLTLCDAELVYAAIRRAAPAGLGRVAAQDALLPPTVPLGAAMALAAGHDRIARQYVASFEDVFALGVAALRRHEAAGTEESEAAARIYLSFLTAFPDSHIARKFGIEAALAVRDEALALAPLLSRPGAWARMRSELLAFDVRLKARGLNPGTSADLTVASLLAVACENILRADDLK
jgi:triphosphoribosyl-dephospho-CoA synthase